MRLLVVAALTLVAGCNDDPVEPSLLNAPRILAVRATPRAIPSGGGQVTLEALTHDAPVTRWLACATPWVPERDPVCPAGALPVGTTNPVTATVPEGTSTLYVRVDATGATPAVFTLTTGEGIPNPQVSGLELATGAPLPPGAMAEGRLQIRPVATNPTGSRLLVTYYTTAGAFEPWRTEDLAPSELRLPRTPGPVTVTVVVRDLTGGVGWTSATLEVQP